MDHYAVKKSVREGGKVLRLWFQDDSIRDIDMVREANRGGVFAQLLDPEYVKGVKLVWDGDLLEFPDGVTWSTEVCWQEGIPVKSAVSSRSTSAKTPGKTIKPAKSA